MKWYRVVMPNCQRASSSELIADNLRMAASPPIGIPHRGGWRKTTEAGHALAAAGGVGAEGDVGFGVVALRLCAAGFGVRRP